MLRPSVNAINKAARKTKHVPATPEILGGLAVSTVVTAGYYFVSVSLPLIYTEIYSKQREKSSCRVFKPSSGSASISKAEGPLFYS